MSLLIFIGFLVAQGSSSVLRRVDEHQGILQETGMKVQEMICEKKKPCSVPGQKCCKGGSGSSLCCNQCGEGDDHGDDHANCKLFAPFKPGNGPAAPAAPKKKKWKRWKRRARTPARGRENGGMWW